MLNSIDLSVAERLRDDPDFRREWFRAELEQGVPEQFRALREARGYTQTHLAELADMKQSAISRFEKSTDAKWNFETLLKMAEAMDAQLIISVRKAEVAIAEYAKEDAERAQPRKSVLDAASLRSQFDQAEERERESALAHLRKGTVTLDIPCPMM